MDETVIVIMLKNSETGFLETEIGNYNVGDNDSLIYNIYALEKDGDITVYVRLTVERDLEDWEFSAVLDYYDTEVMEKIAVFEKEDDTGYNPIWEVSFQFDKSSQVMEEKLSKLLKAHKEELDSVYETIIDFKQDYI